MAWRSGGVAWRINAANSMYMPMQHQWREKIKRIIGVAGGMLAAQCGWLAK